MDNKIVYKIKSIFAIVLLCGFAVFAYLNIGTFLNIAKIKVDEAKINNTTIAFSEIENQFRESVAYRNELVDKFGWYKKTIGNGIIGNFEYATDEQGVIHAINGYNPYDVDGFVREVNELKAYTDQKGIPLLYVQAPNKEGHNKEGAITEFNLDEETMDSILLQLSENGISVLDIREKLLQEEHNFEMSDVFLHTDLHMQTDAEIWMANQIAKELENTLGISLENEKYLEDMSNYTKVSYPLLGNYGRTNGREFVELDTFDMYFPNFDTSFTYIYPEDQSQNRMGSFKDILMNGYTDNEVIDEYTYFVTNYMKFMQPYYTYVNNNQPNTKILVLTDSIAYRGLSYLALNVNQLTITDSRFFGGIDFLKMALDENEFDAVIVLQGTFLMGTEFIYN